MKNAAAVAVTAILVIGAYAIIMLVMGSNTDTDFDEFSHGFGLLISILSAGLLLILSVAKTPIKQSFVFVVPFAAGLLLVEIHWGVISILLVIAAGLATQGILEHINANRSGRSAPRPQTAPRPQNRPRQ